MKKILLANLNQALLYALSHLVLIAVDTSFIPIVLMGKPSLREAAAELSQANNWQSLGLNLAVYRVY